MIQPTFVITNPLQQLELKLGRGELIWTVTNTTPVAVRGQLDIDFNAKEGIDSSCFSLGDPIIRDFAPSQTITVSMSIIMPAGVEEQQPDLTLVVSNVERPQEDYQSGPRITLKKIFWEVKKRSRKLLWCSLVLLFILIAGGIAAAVLMGATKDPLKGKSLAESLIYIQEQQYELADVSWAFNPVLENKALTPGGTVLDAIIVDDEVELVIQLWHKYRTREDLGFTRKQRNQVVADLQASLAELCKIDQPLSNWLSFESEDLLEEAREKQVPLEILGKECIVTFDESYKAPEGT
ncbi:MAG: hypothetical protein HRT88_05705 [Lentisphaeraceae bacterium]|nr:hypothetical protein [Lentisphaeraceae bacterium]